MSLPFSSSNWKLRVGGLPVVEVALATILLAVPKGPSKMNPRDGLTYQWIPPGSYYTGCLPADTECYGLERARQKIIIAQGFWIGRTEVTQAAYMSVMHAAPSRYKGADRPVDSIGWNDATAYCSGIGMRLPTSRSGNTLRTEESQKCPKHHWVPLRGTRQTVMTVLIQRPQSCPTAMDYGTHAGKCVGMGTGCRQRPW